MRKTLLFMLMAFLLVYCSFAPSAFAARYLPPDAPSGCVCAYSYTITYNGNGQTSGSAPSPQSKYPGDGPNVTLRTNSANLAKTGSIFSGWNTNAAGTGTSYAAGELVDLRGNVTLFAEWRTDVPVVKYTATVKNRFDTGYSIYYNEASNTSINNINSYMSDVSNRYLELLSLSITAPSATSFTSLPDTCKQPNNNATNINLLCTKANPCTDRSNMLNNFTQSTTGSCTVSNVLWSGHQCQQVNKLKKYFHNQHRYYQKHLTNPKPPQ